MKKIIVGIIFILSCIGVYSQSGTVVTAPLVPNSYLDNYPTHIDTLGMGGYQSVTDTIQFLNIKSSRLKEGMVVRINSSGNYYMLLTKTPKVWIPWYGGGLTQKLSVGNGLVYHNGKIQLGDTTLNTGFQWRSPDNSGEDYFDLQLEDTATYGHNMRSNSHIIYYLSGIQNGQLPRNNARYDNTLDLLISRGDTHISTWSTLFYGHGASIGLNSGANWGRFIYPYLSYTDRNHDYEVDLDSTGLHYNPYKTIDTSLYQDKTFVTKDWVLYRLSHAISGVSLSAGKGILINSNTVSIDSTLTATNTYVNNKIATSIKDGLLHWDGSKYVPYPDTTGSYRGGTFFYNNYDTIEENSVSFDMNNSKDSVLNYNGGINIYNKSSGNLLYSTEGYNVILSDSGSNQLKSANGSNELNTQAGFNQIYTHSGYNLLQSDLQYNSIYSPNGGNDITSISGNNNISTSSGNNIIYTTTGYNQLFTNGGYKNLVIGDQLRSSDTTVFLRSGQIRQYIGGIKKFEVDATGYVDVASGYKINGIPITSGGGLLETDPIYSASASHGITSTDITNWNSAYSLSHSAVTLGTANGLSLSTQQLSLGTASSSTTGALTSTDWNTFNNKQPAGSYKLTNDSTLSSGYFTNYKATLKEPNLPSQTGNDWKYLRTNGTSKIWDQIYSASGTWTSPSYTDNGNGTVTIGSGEYILNTASDGSGTRNKYTVAGGTFTMTDGVKNYIVADYNSGLPITYSTTNLSLINNRSVVIAYTIDRTGTTLHMLSWDSQGKALPEGILNRLIYTQRFQKESGLTLSDSTGLIVKISSGVLWYGATNATISSFKSGATNNYMYLYSYNGSTWTSSTITSYNNTQYQGASGLVTIGNNNYYTVNWIFRGAGNQQDAYILLGTSQYATIADAEASTTPSNTPPIINSHCIPVGRIIVQKNATTSTEINQIQTQYYLSPSASNHENLAGLLGGDATGHYHLNSTQYTNATNLITNSGLTFDGTTFRNPSTNIIGSTVDLLTLKNTTTTSYSRIKYKATGNTFMSGVANNAETTYGIPNRYYIADSTANAVRFSIDGAGNLFKGISDTIISKSVYRDMLSKMTAKSIADTVVVKDKNSLKYVTTVSIPYGTSIQAYSAGNPYSLTNTSALIHFSTTDPSITIPTSGTWKITACVYLEYDTCTFSTNSTYTFKLRRTNNTATDLSNSSTNNLYTGITTSLTQGLGSIQLPVIYYSTTNTSDIIQLWGNLSAIPNSGSFRVRQAWINAEQIY